MVSCCSFNFYVYYIFVFFVVFLFYIFFFIFFFIFFLGLCFFFFFFSSRRRHTRWNCDWSSDVCSSDLARPSRRLAQIPERSVEAEWTARTGIDFTVDQASCL